MSDMMNFPKTPLEFVKSYKFKDSDEIYTNGSELIPVFRVEQMLEHYYKPLKEKATPKKPKKAYMNLKGYDYYNYICPNCKCFICFDTEKDKVQREQMYCKKCGQSLLWPKSDEE